MARIIAPHTIPNLTHLRHVLMRVIRMPFRHHHNTIWFETLIFQDINRSDFFHFVQIDNAN